jgi:hypothetical protein
MKERIDMLDKVQDPDKEKTKRNLWQFDHTITKLQYTYKRLLYDLPLDYHDKETEALVEEALQKLQFAANKYRRAL